MPDLLIMHKRIDIDASPVLYDLPFTPETLAADWEPRGGDWSCDDGALLGRNPHAGNGFIFSHARYPGDVLLDFTAHTVLPSTHDIDVMWRAAWDAEKSDRGMAYVAGIQGWWEGKLGLEKSPDYTLAIATPCPWFQPGREYRVQAGIVDNHSFIFVDGELKLEFIDPDPIDGSRYNQVGFETYQSAIRISRLVIRRPVWEPRTLAYAAEF